MRCRTITGGTDNWLQYLWSPNKPRRTRPYFLVVLPSPDAHLEQVSSLVHGIRVLIRASGDVLIIYSASYDSNIFHSPPSGTSRNPYFMTTALNHSAKTILMTNLQSHGASSGAALPSIIPQLRSSRTIRRAHEVHVGVSAGSLSTRQTQRSCRLC